MKNINNSNNFYLSLVPSIWIILFFIIPIFIVFNTSLCESIFSIPPISSVCRWLDGHLLNIKINFENYFRLIKESYYLLSFVNTVVISVTVTFICFVFGFAMAYAICKTGERTRSILMSMVSLSLWTATLIRIYAWINLLGTNGVINNFLSYFGIAPIKFLGNYYTVCIGLLFCYLPYMILPLYSVLEKFDKSYIEAAYDLGCSPASTFLHVILPLCKNGIITGCIIVFSSTIGEFVVPELLGSSDVLLFGRILWMEFFNNLDWPMACALSIVVMIFIITPIYVLQKKYSEAV
ncbi:MAG: ABC transporter permease [Alphaproteobacteria bacterium]|nr:ABC transporter permease [Alphaproteobacteria bacterium]